MSSGQLTFPKNRFFSEARLFGSISFAEAACPQFAPCSWEMPAWRDVPLAEREREREREQLERAVRRWLERCRLPRHAVQWKEALRELEQLCLSESALRAVVAYLLSYPTSLAFERPHPPELPGIPVFTSFIHLNAVVFPGCFHIGYLHISA